VRCCEEADEHLGGGVEAGRSAAHDAEVQRSIAICLIYSLRAAEA
jgi:hypothetical protein